MAINKKLIHFKSKENFEKEVANENILDTSICFILDSKEISTHGTIYKTVNWSVLEDLYVVSFNTNPELLKLLYANGLTEDENYTTKEELAAINDEQFKAAFSGNTTLKDLLDLLYFTGITTIPENCFTNNNNLKNIIIPNNIIKIENSAFYGCTSLTSIRIPDSVTSIKDKVFYRCTSLISIEIGNGITSIGWQAFELCSKLSSVYIKDMAAWCKIYFSNSTATPLYYAENFYLNDKKITNLIISEGITSIGPNAFNNFNSLTSVKISNSVTLINNWVFHSCNNLTHVEIGSNVTKIGTNVFSGCNLNSIICKAVVPPIITKDTFSSTTLTQPLYVPAESIEAYLAADYWNGFTNIQAL